MCNMSSFCRSRLCLPALEKCCILASKYIARVISVDTRGTKQKANISRITRIETFVLERFEPMMLCNICVYLLMLVCSHSISFLICKSFMQLGYLAWPFFFLSVYVHRYKYICDAIYVLFTIMT